MTYEEEAQYHIDKQAEEITAMGNRTEPFEHTIAGINLTVLPNVYPGGLDSELVCKVMQINNGDSVLDLCTGTGVVALKAASLGANKVVGVDLNPNAVKNGKLNQERLGLKNLEFLEGSLFEPVKGSKFDVIAINPPYTNKKPANKTEICFWDEDNQTTKDFFKEFKDYLKPGGRVYFAWADFSSTELIEDLAKDNGVTLKLLDSSKTPSGLATFLVFQIV